MHSRFYKTSVSSRRTMPIVLLRKQLLGGLIKNKQSWARYYYLLRTYYMLLLTVKLLNGLVAQKKDKSNVYHCFLTNH